MQHLKKHKFPFKNVIVLAIECKMYLKIQRKLHCLGSISKQTRDLSWRKQGWIPRGTISWWKASLPPQKESWAFFWTFSEKQNSCLKTSAWWSRGSHCVENGYLSLRFPNMVKVNIHEHWTRVTRFNPLWLSGMIKVYLSRLYMTAAYYAFLKRKNLMLRIFNGVNKWINECF